MVEALKGNPAVTGLCPAARIYGEAQPQRTAWPFIRYGFPIMTPEEVSGHTGSRNRVTIHTFARGPSMDDCADLVAAVTDTLDGQDITLQFPAGVTRQATVFECFLVGSQIIPDGTDDWHGIVEFSAVVAGA